MVRFIGVWQQESSQRPQRENGATVRASGLIRGTLGEGTAALGLISFAVKPEQSRLLARGLRQATICTHTTLLDSKAENVHVF